jgi:hypothetical protein
VWNTWASTGYSLVGRTAQQNATDKPLQGTNLAAQVLAGVLLQAAIAETLFAVVGYTTHQPEQIAADLLLIAASIFAAVRLRRYPSHDAAR